MAVHRSDIRQYCGVLPELTHRVEDGRALPALVWRLPAPLLGASTGPLGGGIGIRDWVLNMTVPLAYARMDPDVHLAEVADELRLAGSGVGLMTGVDVAHRVITDEDGVIVAATVGMNTPVWAAAPATTPAPYAGTVNIVVQVPARLADAAMINAVATVVEARAQAMWDLGLPGTGTPSDAICVLCPPGGAAWAYGGTRSHWGSRVARAVHRAVIEGGRRGCR